MPINSKSAFNMINKYKFIITYFFFFNYVYKDLIKKNYLGKTFFSKLKDFLNSTSFATLYKQKYAKQNMEFLNTNICPLGFHNRVMTAYTKKNETAVIHEFNDIYNVHNVKLKFIDMFYELLSNTFCSSNLKYDLFSIFKSKIKKDNAYYLLLGKINLEKNLSDNNKFNFYSLFNTFENCKYIPIGNYFIFVKFTIDNNHINIDNLSSTLRKLSKNSYIKRDKLINLIDIKYILTEQDIDNRYELVQENILEN